MSVIYHKLWSDLWRHKARTIQVILIIAMGVLAVGAIIGGRNLTITAINESWRAASPPMMRVWVKPALNDDKLAALKHVGGLSVVEGMQTASLEWRLSPTDEWQPGSLVGRDDYADQKLSKVILLKGQWPRKNSLAVIKSADSFFNINLGDQVYLKINDNEYMVNIGGVAADEFTEPLTLGGTPAFFASRGRFGELTGEENFNIIMGSAPVYDESLLKDISQRVLTQLKKQNFDVGGAGHHGDPFSNPDQHGEQEAVDGVMLILGMVGLAVIGLGMFLNYNTINAIITEQINQIGIMKAVGGRSWQILQIYLAMVFIYGLGALLVAFVPAALAAYGLMAMVVNLFDLAPGPLALDPWAVTAQVAVALLSPLLAALIPIRSGLCVTVREAVSTYGLTGAVNWVDRLLAQTRRIPHMILLTLGNTFRHTQRVALTLLTLSASGVIFMVVISVQYAATSTFAQDVPAVHKFQVTLAFDDPQRVALIERLTLAQPGVEAVELRLAASGRIRPAGQPKMKDTDLQIDLFGLPVSTRMYTPPLVAGRWLEPQDTNGIVLTQIVADQVGVGLGDWLTLYHDARRESTWQVVGLVADPLLTYVAFMPYATLSRELGSINRANSVWVQTTVADEASTARMAQTLRQVYTDRNITVSSESVIGEQTIFEISGEVQMIYGVIIAVLAALAALMAGVGGVGLSGILTLNVLERRREIGVMRAIGASSGKIIWLLIGEGLILGLLSWLIAVPFSVPLSGGFTQLLAGALDISMTSHYAALAPVYWLVIVVVLSILASWFPARGATRISVNESLAYQ